ncbi:MAG: pre-peptidase C-terminal domain-containing protein [bacterium]|nr:pre-peptidase C-terminal domain-containing protein [bacterium]
MIVTAVLAGSLVPAAASSPAAAQEQTSWYVNDNPRLFGPSQYWYWGDPGHGYGSNYYRYTYAIAGESSPDNWARWSMGRRVGRQEIQAYVPSNHATATVTYRIDVGGREYTRRVAQRNVSGWTSLGNVEADGARVTITVRDNEASQHHSRHGLAASRIGVDAIRMRCVARCSTSPPAPPPSPAPQPPPPSPQPPPPPPPSRASAGACEPAGVLRGVAGAVSGIPSVEWDAGCVSGVRGNGDHYARRYRLDVRDAGEVTIELSSQTDTYLYLLDAQGDVIVEDDDGGSGTDSRIVRDLSVGRYLVEATTYRAGASGSFTLGVRVARSASPPPPPPPPPPPAPPPPTSRPSAGACGIAGVLRGVAGAVSGIPSVEWDAGCVSGVRGNGDHYARRYRLDVRDAGEVTIELSSQTDTYLYLLDAQGDVIVEDDDGGSGTDSRIVRDLSVGRYLVEATTYRAGASGSFTLGVRVARSASPPSPPPPSSQGSDSSSGCGVVSLGAVGGSVSRGGAWTADCESSQRSGRFARVFGFTLGAEREVTVDLESSVDAYLYLLDGQGRVVDEDDDGGSGLNSRITRTLAAGTYRVEATTYSSGASGSFTLGVRVGAGAPSSPTTPVLAMGDDARPSGRCSSPSCRWFRISNLRPGSRVECWRENMGAAYATFTASSETSTRNCYFSYVGARVYVVANGVRSNTITWPSAPVQPSPPPPPSAQRASEPLSGCAVESLGTVGGSVSRGGAWAAGCESSQRSGRFARVFDFSLSGEREVTVDLESDVDTYLYLLDSRGRRIDEDDDGGSGLNSRITRTLAAGTYRVEATTYSASRAGEFTLRITAKRKLDAPQLRLSAENRNWWTFFDDEDLLIEWESVRGAERYQLDWRYIELDLEQLRAKYQTILQRGDQSSALGEIQEINTLLSGDTVPRDRVDGDSRPNDSSTPEVTCYVRGYGRGPWCQRSGTTDRVDFDTSDMGYRIHSVQSEYSLQVRLRAQSTDFDNYEFNGDWSDWYYVKSSWLNLACRAVTAYEQITDIKTKLEIAGWAVTVAGAVAAAFTAGTSAAVGLGVREALKVAARELVKRILIQASIKQLLKHLLRELVKDLVQDAVLGILRNLFDCIAHGAELTASDVRTLGEETFTELSSDENFADIFGLDPEGLLQTALDNWRRLY